MKKLLAAASLAALFGASAASAATTNYMIGATWSIGGNSPQMGVSARVLLSDTGSQFGVGGGATYYMGSGMLGFDAVGAWMNNNVVVGGGYDFASFSPVFTLGAYQ